jgi:hypothetical protein
MKLIEGITNDANQTFSLVLPDGSDAQMALNYRDGQKGWFYSIIYGSILVNYNRRLVNSLNLLRQFRGKISFGLSCIVKDGMEPDALDDFTSGRVEIYLLNETERDNIEDNIIPTFKPDV